jgi:hypothetical protein
METIQTSPAIEIISTSTDTLVLRVTAPFQYFTESDFQIQEDNPNSTFNNYIGYRKTLKTILHKVFVTREYKLIAQALISLKINETNYSNAIISANIIQHAGVDGLEDYTEFPNPHLWHYNCWNTARTEMAKNLAAGKYELAVLQMVAAVQSLNIAENASFNNGLVADLTSRPSLQKLAHFIIEDGTILSLPELIEHEEKLEKEQALEKAKETLKTQSQEYTQVELPNIAWEGEDDATN